MRKYSSRPDAENPEWTEEDFRRARPISEFPGVVGGDASVPWSARETEGADQGADQPPRRSRRRRGLPGHRPWLADSRQRGSTGSCERRWPEKRRCEEEATGDGGCCQTRWVDRLAESSACRTCSAHRHAGRTCRYFRHLSTRLNGRVKPDPPKHQSARRHRPFSCEE